MDNDRNRPAALPDLAWHRHLHPRHPLDFDVDRYRLQFEIIASYLTGFLISGLGFGAIVVPARSGCTAPGAWGRTAAAVVAAASKAIATNAVIVRRYDMETSVAPGLFPEGRQPGRPFAQCLGAVE